MILKQDIIVNHKGLIMHFVKGSIVENKGKATYILPPKKTKVIVKMDNDVLAEAISPENGEIITEK